MAWFVFFSVVGGEWLFRVAVRKKSAQILMGVVPVAWKASSVGQIWSQMKKLVFLKKHLAKRFLFSTQLSHNVISSNEMSL